LQKAPKVIFRQALDIMRIECPDIMKENKAKSEIKVDFHKIPENALNIMR
jgi:hypothetical protein